MHPLQKEFYMGKNLEEFTDVEIETLGEIFWDEKKDDGRNPPMPLIIEIKRRNIQTSFIHLYQ